MTSGEAMLADADAIAEVCGALETGTDDGELAAS